MRDSFQYKPLSPLELTGAIKWLIIANAVVYVFQVFAGRSFIYTFGLVPYALTRHFRIWQLFTYMFLYGGIFHLFFNLFILWMFGKSVEDAWDTKSFLKYYLICGLGTAIAIVLTGPNSKIVNIGASGAIYGILVAFAMLYPETTIYFYFLIPVKAKYLAIILGVIAFLSGISSSGSNIAHFGHLGGLVAGYLYLKYPVGKYRFPSINRWRPFRKIYPNAEGLTAETREEETNRILDKILSQGVDSLTAEEKEIMEKYVERREE